MTDNFQSRFDPTKRGGNPSAGDASDPTLAEDNEGLSENPAYTAVSSGRWQKSMLEFRLKSGNAMALAYSYLVSVEIDPSRAIEMDFSGYRVFLHGRHLQPLFTALVAQRVAVVRETDELQSEAAFGPNVTVVSQIEIVPIHELHGLRSP